MEKAFETKAVSEIEVLVARAKRDVAVADVKAAEAALVRAKLDLSYTTIEAPITGRISKYFVSVGNLVGGTEATLLATLVVEKPIRATFTLDERTILPFLQRSPRPDRPGANVPPVSLELADGSRHPETGRIDYVDNRVDPDTGTLTARAEFPNENGGLVAGLFARVLIPDERKDALLVPDLAIQRDLAGSYLLVVDDRNTVQSRYVKPGPRVGAERIIDEGLAAGERVIVAGLQRARPGIEVRAETKPAPADDATAPRAEAEGTSEQE
jgi:RND family efflux transporter MFP subunit